MASGKIIGAVGAFLVFMFVFLLCGSAFTTISDEYNITYNKDYTEVNRLTEFSGKIDTNIRGQIDEEAEFNQGEEIQVSPLNAIKGVLTLPGTISKSLNSLFTNIPLAAWAKEFIIVGIIIIIVLLVVSAIWRFEL